LLWIAHQDRDVLVPLADHRINAVLLGSGWLVSGDGSQQRARMVQAMAGQTDGRHWVLDAGALSAFADRPDELRALLAPWGGRVVLTPHAGEFERLFSSVVPASDDQVSRTREAAAFIGAVVVRKGSQTWIACPGGDCWGHDASDMPWLATAGTGDVLAGLIAGLLAQGLTAQQAAGAGCWLQRQAARLAVVQGGGMGLIAEDLLDQLRAAWQALDQMAPRS
jgi:NAD(P)H-hydrate epimerase